MCIRDRYQGSIWCSHYWLYAIIGNDYDQCAGCIRWSPHSSWSVLPANQRLAAVSYTHLSGFPVFVFSFLIWLCQSITSLAVISDTLRLSLIHISLCSFLIIQNTLSALFEQTSRHSPQWNPVSIHKSDDNKPYLSLLLLYPNLPSLIAVCSFL